MADADGIGCSVGAGTALAVRAAGVEGRAAGGARVARKPTTTITGAATATARLAHRKRLRGRARFGSVPPVGSLTPEEVNSTSDA